MQRTRLFLFLSQGPREEKCAVRDLFWAPLYIITDWELFSTMTKKLGLYASLFYIITIHPVIS